MHGVTFRCQQMKERTPESQQRPRHFRFRAHNKSQKMTSNAFAGVWRAAICFNTVFDDGTLWQDNCYSDSATARSFVSLLGSSQSRLIFFFTRRIISVRLFLERKQKTMHFSPLESISSAHKLNKNMLMNRMFKIDCQC